MSTGPTRADPAALGARCRSCPFAKGGVAVRPVLGVGPREAAGILVGESPGREEAERGRPFVGPTGQALDDELLRAGLQRSKLFIVNAMCCQPPPGVRSVTMMARAADCCRPALIAQLKRQRPAQLFAAGKWAFYALTGKTKGLNKARGFVRPFSFLRTIEINETFGEKLEKERRKKLKAAAAKAGVPGVRGRGAVRPRVRNPKA